MRAYLICLCAVFIVTIFVIRAQDKTVKTAAVVMEKSDCNKCHTPRENKKPLAPTYAQIAAKYSSDSVSTPISTLIERVKKRSKGHWNEISRGMPMPPFSGSLSDAQIRSLVEWILTQKN